jgi:hypothetical protein
MNSNPSCFYVVGDDYLGVRLDSKRSIKKFMEAGGDTDPYHGVKRVMIWKPLEDLLLPFI